MKRYVIFISNQGNANLEHQPPTEMVKMKAWKRIKFWQGGKQQEAYPAWGVAN